MDTDTLRAVLATVPAGRWASYADVATAAGGTPMHARVLNARLTKTDLPGAHRVLKARGEVALNALGDPGAVRARLETEGVVFDERGRAPQEARFVPEGAAPPPGTTRQATVAEVPAASGGESGAPVAAVGER